MPAGDAEPAPGTAGAVADDVDVGVDGGKGRVQYFSIQYSVFSVRLRGN